MKDSKIDQLLKLFLSRKYMRTSEVISWGNENYFNRASRSARLLANEGYIRRLTNTEKKFLYGKKIKEGVWVLIKTEGPRFLKLKRNNYGHN